MALVSSRRLTIALTFAALLLALLATADGSDAQSAATAAADAGSAEREVLLQAVLERTEGDPLELRLLRITLEPGGVSPLHAHPGLGFGVVESGSLAVQVTGRAVLRPADLNPEEPSQLVPVGVEVRLGPGDRIAYAPGTQLTFRNPGPERTMLLAATVLPTGEGAPPSAIFVAGPPSATEVAGVRSLILGRAVVVDFPDRRSAVSLERLSLGAGDRVPAFGGPVLVAVEAGGLSGTVEGAVELPDAAGFAAANATPTTDSGAGTRFTLAAGQSIFFPSGMAESPPLGGDGSAMLLRLGIVPLADEVDSPMPSPVQRATATAIQAPTAAPTATATASPAPSPSPTPDSSRFAVGTEVVVAVDMARLRSEPSLEGSIMAGLEQGRVLVVIGEPVEGPDHIWYPVQDLADPALTGYIAGDLLAPAT